MVSAATPPKYQQTALNLLLLVIGVPKLFLERVGAVA